MNSQLELPSAHGRRRLFYLSLVVGLLLLVILILFGRTWAARWLGADSQAIARVMPQQLIAFAEIDLMQLQNDESQAVANAFADLLDVAEVPFSREDPTTAFNIFDQPLNEWLGLTVSNDVRPWVGFNAAVALFPAPADGAQMPWLLAATIRDTDTAELFIDKVNSSSPTDRGNQPAASRVGNVLLLAADAATLALVSADGPKLADLSLFQETLAHLPEQRALTVYIDQPQSYFSGLPFSEIGGTTAVAEPLLDLWPTYTAVGLAGYAIKSGVQLDVVGVHAGLSETQQALLAAQTAGVTIDQQLPANTAVLLMGQRPDLIWATLKQSLDGLGYSAADIDEASEMFSGLFGFNLDTDLLASLNSGYAVAVVPDSQTGLWPPIFLAEHANPSELEQQMASLARGVSILGLNAEDTNGIYLLHDSEQQLLAAFSQIDGRLLVSNQLAGVTAVAQAEQSLPDNPDYVAAKDLLPSTAVPFLFVDLSQLSQATAVSFPITQLIGGSYSEADVSKSSFILRIEPSN